jgi:hypothetical protein
MTMPQAAAGSNESQSTTNCVRCGEGVIGRDIVLKPSGGCLVAETPLGVMHAQCADEYEVEKR